MQLADKRAARRVVAEKEAEQLHARLRDRAEHIADLQKVIAALTPAPERAAIPQPSPPATASAVPVPGQAEAPAVPAATEAPATGQHQAPERRRWWPRRNG